MSLYEAKKQIYMQKCSELGEDSLNKNFFLPDDKDWDNWKLDNTFISTMSFSVLRNFRKSKYFEAVIISDKINFNQ